MAYNFDSRGNLFPYKIIRIESLEEFEQLFVMSFPLSVTRLSIYTGLLKYIEALGETLNQVSYTGSWRLWIDGSFTTNKLNPNDIDVLSLLNNEVALRENKICLSPFSLEMLFVSIRLMLIFYYMTKPLNLRN